MNASSPTRQNQTVPEFPEVAFGRGADALLVALVGETAFAMAPGRDGRHHLVTAWRIPRPMDEWKRSDFYGHSGELADETAFRAAVLENAKHQRERKMLGRFEVYSHAHTPWGASQGATVYAEGVEQHSTAGHGGFKLSAEENRKVHPSLRSTGGWYEEDCEWAIVAITFPHLFTTFERCCAERTIKDSWPDAWETIFGTVLAPGESYEKDRRSFELAHANDWIVISAVTSTHCEGFVECVATPGGRRGAGTEERCFLVPSAEYEVRRFGFVIDPNRHQVYGGPSDFVGWQAGSAT
ncbi:hypothetical protein H8B02_22150 [Bradyrhizobium sp. Pear77]|uniref:DUF7007 domain-containing protein n=1 Tax=Bradyrhizobium TaxID=374 RepID=UPI001E39B7E3|nr:MULTISPECIES: hypothetical protein [Bradyrhizobium]MCC8956033.1 hypothetical protein [Bradyrhizobium altum]MCC8966475.1 hypothetical protein [Bradyrhizobium oropedii]